MNSALTRFYSASELFRDDIRLMATAIKEHSIVSDTRCSIYKDLLNCRYTKWIDILEECQHLASDEWMDCKEFMMDNGHDKIFAKNDIDNINAMCN